MSPEIQTTLGAVAKAEPALTRLADLKLPMKTAYHVVKLLRYVQAEARSYHHLRDSHVRELGAERPTTEDERARGHREETVTEVLPKHWPEFVRRVVELEAIAVTIQWGPLLLADLGDIEITPADLLAMGPFLLLETPEPAAEPVKETRS